MNINKKIIINGGGICGLTTAIALQDLAFDIEIYEAAAILKLCLVKELTTKIAFTSFEKLRVPRTIKIVKTSWTFGKLAQLSNSAGINVRNFIVKNIPKSVTKKQTDFLYKVSFD